jgi:6-phosphogluconolactonase
MTPAVRWHPFPDARALSEAAVRRILAAESRANSRRGRFTIVLAGGETPRAAYALLARHAAEWRAWHVYFGDERCLPPDDPARNLRMARDALLDCVPIPAAQIHVIQAELGALRAAPLYARLIANIGLFDLVLLGLGEDGHTASLFPGRDLGVEADVIAVADAPKPPPERVTLSAARLSRAHEVLFLVGGEGKRHAVARWRAGEPIPAAAIRPPGGVDVLITAAACPAL